MLSDSLTRFTRKIALPVHKKMNRVIKTSSNQRSSKNKSQNVNAPEKEQNRNKSHRARKSNRQSRNKGRNKDFDERQTLVRGRGYKYGFCTLLLAIALILAMITFDVLPRELTFFSMAPCFPMMMPLWLAFSQ